MSGICVAICTYDRPDGLRMLLGALSKQLRELDASLVVVDNGRHASAEIVKSQMASDAAYVRLAEAGLVAARNAALRASLEISPEFIAFIDDDEVPDDGWLRGLVDCLKTTGADICCGPLRPRFEGQPPTWALAGGFFAKSGTHLGTGNMMFRTSILPRFESEWFQADFAHTGGEDEELFSRLIAAGARFATAHSAWVTEHVPASRYRLGYMVRTGLRDGAIAVALARARQQSAIKMAFGHAIAKMGYALAHLPLAIGASWHLVAALRDIAEVAGTIAALFGWRIRHYG